MFFCGDFFCLLLVFVDVGVVVWRASVHGSSRFSAAICSLVETVNVEISIFFCGDCFLVLPLFVLGVAFSWARGDGFPRFSVDTCLVVEVVGVEISVFFFGDCFVFVSLICVGVPVWRAIVDGLPRFSAGTCSAVEFLSSIVMTSECFFPVTFFLELDFFSLFLILSQYWFQQVLLICQLDFLLVVVHC